MTEVTSQRLFGVSDAFDQPVVAGLTIAIAAILLVTPALAFLLLKATALRGSVYREVISKWKTWAALTPLLIGPIILGAFWTILLLLGLSLWCYREYSRATGLFRSRGIHVSVVVGIALVHFAVLDHWYDFFVALMPIMSIVIVVVGLFPDEPKGFIQRVALGIFGFMLIGIGLGHLAYLANDSAYRSIILMILVSVEMNDVFGYVAGKLFGRRKLAPKTSPGKTAEGTIGALVLTTIMVAVLGHWVFEGTKLDHPQTLITLGLLVSVTGQLGDLTLSSIKRDVGIKDMSATLSAHGGLLDRFDSLLLVAPTVFHYVGYFLGIGLDQPARILSGGV